MAVQALPQSLFNTNWIIDKKTDLTWFIGGALGGYLLMFMYSGLGWDMVTIWFFWVALIDTPHFFGTYSRTYLDKKEFNQRKPLLLGSLVWFIVGPAIIFLCYLLYSAGSTSYELPWILLTSFFGFWAYWHVVRQHYGFLALYKKKNKEQSKLDYYIDSSLLYSGLMLPFFVFVMRYPEASEITLPIQNALESLFGISGLTFITWSTISVVSVFALIYIGRQVYLAKKGTPINIPKALFLLAVIPLHLFICFSDAVVEAGIFAFGAFVTIFHDLQYHAIVWFHHKNRYKKAANKSEFGISAWLTESLPRYALVAITVGVVFRVIGCTFEAHPGCIPIVLSSDIMLFADFGTDKVLLAGLMGFAFHHYFLDQFIWKTSKDKELAKDLKLNDL